jgi:molybdate transport system substrate-binding protein
MNSFQSYLMVTCQNRLKDMQKMHWVMCVSRTVLAVLGLLLMGLAQAAQADGMPVRVMAASDLKFALAHIAKIYEQETRQSVEVTYGSSGTLARQLVQGLPADLFMSADEALVAQLAQAGLTRSVRKGGWVVADPGVLYAQGRLALAAPVGSALPLDGELTALRKSWPAKAKFAIANPAHAPYGRAAQQALESLGLWSAVQPHLVLGENIAQTTQFVATGAAAMGVSSLSLVQAPELGGQVRFVPLAAHLHHPIRQRMVLLKGASAAALAFYDYLQQPAARAVLLQYGLEAPP